MLHRARRRRRPGHLDRRRAAGRRRRCWSRSRSTTARPSSTTLRAGVARQVLDRPDPRLLPDTIGLGDNSFPPAAPGCDWAGALAAGAVDFPSDTTTYQVGPGTTATIDCYRGAVVQVDTLAVLGSADLLRNDHIAAPGAAALAINLITDDLTVRRVTWLMPGAGAPGQPTASDLGAVPGGAQPRRVLAADRRRRPAGPVARPPASARSSPSRCRWSSARPRWSRATAGCTGGRERATGPPPRCGAAASSRLAARAGLSRRATAPDVTAAARRCRAVTLRGGRGPAADRHRPTTSQLVTLAAPVGRTGAAAAVRPRTSAHTTNEGTSPVTTASTEARDGLHRLRAEVAKAVVGQDAAVTGVLIGLLCRGHVLHRRRPGRRQDAAGAHAVGRARPAHRAHPVHRRPDARRRHRFAHLRHGDRPLRVPRRAGVHQPAARRRDQPHAAQDPVGAAGGDGGAPGLGRGPAAPAARPVLRHRHAEPGRVRGHLSAARGATGPVPRQGDDAPARPRDRGRGSWPRTPPVSTRAIWPGPA